MRPEFMKALSEHDISLVHESSVRILVETGVMIQLPELLEKLGKPGKRDPGTVHHVAEPVDGPPVIPADLRDAGAELWVKLTRAAELTTYHLLRAETVVMTKGALATVEEVFGE